MRLIDKIIQQPNKLGNYIDFGTGSKGRGYHTVYKRRTKGHVFYF
jgi:hypothetical protein